MILIQRLLLLENRKSKGIFMKKASFLFFLIFPILLLIGCFSRRSEQEEDIYDKDLYRIYFNNQAVSEEGVLVGSGLMLYFDADSRQMVPLCTRSECEHKYADGMTESEAECPAAYLGLKSEEYAIYGDKIWYIDPGEKAWEFWTADLDGENHRKQWDIHLEESYPSGISLFYQGYYYGIQDQIRFSNEIENRKRIIAISLTDGHVQAVTDWLNTKTLLWLVGVHKDSIYYTVLVQETAEKQTHRLLCKDLRSGEEEILAESDSWIYAAMDAQWLGYGVLTEDGTDLMLRNLKRGEDYILYEKEDMEPYGFDLTNGKLIWYDIHPESGTYTYFFYDIEEKKLQETKPYQRLYDMWVNFGDIWFCRASKSYDEVGLLPNNDDYNEYFYITQEDLLTGRELTQVK